MIACTMAGAPVARARVGILHDARARPTRGSNLGIEGTPMIIASNGVVLGGYVEPLELLRRLQSIESQRASH